jgi:hypothetical protein
MDPLFSVRGQLVLAAAAWHDGRIKKYYWPRMQKLINDGAKTIVVSGVPPMGCAPGSLVLLAGPNKSSDYEPDTGCLKNLNLLSKDHNSQLRQALTRQAPRRAYHLRRLLLPHHRLRGVSRPLRVRRGQRRRPADLLRRRRREVQFQPHQGMWDARRQGVCGPGGVRELGRHPPYRSGIPSCCRFLAPGPVRQPVHTQRA